MELPDDLIPDEKKKPDSAFLDSLIESELRYRRLFESAKDGILILDATTGKITDVNPFLIELLNIPKEEFIGRELWEVGLFRDIEANKEKFQKLHQLEYVHEDFPLETKDGRKIQVEFIGNVYKVNKSNVIQCNIRNCTERNAIQNRIKFQAELLNNVGQAIIATDLQGIIIYYNHAAEQIYGWSSAEVMGQNILELSPAQQTQVQAKELMDKLNESKSWSGELLVQRKDGSSFPAEVTATPIFDKNKKLAGIIGISSDISERKLLEEVIQESEEKFRMVFENVFDGISIYSEDVDPLKRKLIDCNERYATQSGRSRDELLKLGNTYGLQINLDEKANENRLDSLKMEASYKGIFSWIRPDGKENVLEYVGMPVTWRGKLYSIGIDRDITERIMFEKELIEAKGKAEESDRLKSAFLANMSHEIRTPMNGILGFTGLLKEPQLTGEEQLEYIDIIEKSGTRMLEIINNIVNISKIESGLMEIFISATNINEQIEFIYNLFKPEADRKKLKISFKKGLAANEATIKTDTEKVYAILTNLVNNAIKFTSFGFVEFGYVKKDNYLEFFVEDTGRGIPNDQKELIFERFRQGSESLNRNYEGSGLGLSICKSYVEMLGGRIWIDNGVENNLKKGYKEKGGSMFYFTLPYVPVYKEKITDIIDIEDSTLSYKLRNLKILVAEDDAISQRLISSITRKIVKEVILVGTGTKAVKACAENPDIDLVLMDIKMPEMDGYEATRQIRKFNKEVYIIAQTAYGIEGDRAKAIEAGCNDYIVKPINPALLKEMIKAIFVK